MIDAGGTSSVAAEIMFYWSDHGKGTIGASSVGSYLRHFIGFLLQDEIGLECTFDELTPSLWKRFIKWRQKSHHYKLVWLGKEFDYKSKGVANPSIRKNIFMVLAACNYSVDEGRTPKSQAPAAPKLDESFSSSPREKVFTFEQMGAIVGYARHDPPLLHYILLQLATAIRPEAGLKMIPSEQYDPVAKLIDLHPKTATRTKKRNPVVPCIDAFGELIKDHKGHWVMEDSDPIKSMRTRWRLVRKLLGFDSEIVFKTIRHSVASHLEYLGCDEKQTERLMGHVGENSTTARYKHYNPNFMKSVRNGLETIWERVMQEADLWCEKHRVATGPHNKKIIIQRSATDDGSNEQLHIAETGDETEIANRKRARQDQINAARRRRKEREQTKTAAPSRTRGLRLQKAGAK